MGWKRWELDCPCCSTCDVTFHATSCGLSGYAYWGNLVPPGLVSPSSVAVYMANCTGFLNPGGGLCDTCYGVSSPVSETFYPLLDPSTTGIHTFHLQKNEADTLVIEYDNSYWPISATNKRLFYLVDSDCNDLCNTTVSSKLLAIDKISIIDPPCVYPAIEGGATWHVDYDRSIVAAALNLLDGALPYQINSFTFAGQQCGITYCPPSCTGINCICGGFSCNIQGPFNTNYYKVFVNNNKVTFTISQSYPLIVDQIYSSDYQLLYSYVTYYTSGSPVLCSPGFTYGSDMAVVSFSYGGIVVNGGPNFNCTLPGMSVDIPFIPELSLYAPYQCNQCPTLPCFCGPTAFQDANNFTTNLPQTIQPGQYGSTIGTMDPGESFSSSQVSGDCTRPIYYNMHSFSDCDNNVTSGYHTLTLRTN